MADDNHRTVRRIKLLGVKPYGDPTEVEVPKDMDIREAGWLEGCFNIWVDAPADGETEKLNLRLLNDGSSYDPDEYELIKVGVRTNGRPVSLLKAK